MPKKAVISKISSTNLGAEMTNFYLSAYAGKPLIRGAIMQSGDSKP